MDRFDQQIAKQKPTYSPVTLNEREFMKKLLVARRVHRTRRILLALMVLASIATLAGALRRNIFEILVLTFRYVTDLPFIGKELAGAFSSAVSWPGIIALLLVIALSAVLLRSRKEMNPVRGHRTYAYAAAVAVLALACGVLGALSSSAHANAQTEALKRKLNERGHLEVEVDSNSYELYGKSQASDDSIRGQATIETLRNFNITKAYPELKEMRNDGFVTEVRSIDKKDDCVYYVERRLEPTLSAVVDANSGCIRSDMTAYYLNENLQPIKTPTWQKGQVIYLTSARRGHGTATNVSVFILLSGKADNYVAKNNGEKIVPKGKPSTGAHNCGVRLQDTCPDVGYIDVFTNAEGKMASGEIGSSVPGNSLKPRPGAEMIEVFGKITSMDDRVVTLVTSSGTKFVISWPKNIIEQFNTEGATHHQMTNGPLRIEAGDYLVVRPYYKEGMNVQQLSLSDISFIGVAIKSAMPDPLANESYSKQKAVQLEKYQ